MAARKPRAASAIAATPPAPSALPAAAPTPNTLVGEDKIVLDGAAYLLRPSHKAIVAIEAKTGQPLLSLVRLGDSGELTLDQLAIVTTELIRAGGTDEMTRNVGAQRIGELIYDSGIITPMAKLTLILVDAAKGGRDAAGNRKAASGNG